MNKKVFIKNFRTGYYVTNDGVTWPNGISGEHYWNIRMTPYCDKEKSAWFLADNDAGGPSEIYNKDTYGGKSVNIFLAKGEKLPEDPSSCGSIGVEELVIGKTNLVPINQYSVYYKIAINDEKEYYMKAPRIDIEKLIFVPSTTDITNENLFIIDDFENR